MYKYLVCNLIYVFWTLLNVCHDTIFKYYNHLPFFFIFLIRYICIFLVSFIYINVKDKITQISYKEKKLLINLNFFKGIFTLLAMIFVYKQIENNSLFSVNLIFFSIPLFDILIDRIISNKTKDSNFKLFFLKHITTIIYNLIILVFFIKEVYFYGFMKNIYGFIGSLMFSISNIFILKTQKVWKNNLALMPYDIYYFSFYMIILSIISIVYYKIPFLSIIINYSNFLNLYFIIYIILGIIIQFLLYYLFFKNDFTPSSILVSIDLIVALIFGVFFGNETITLIEILIIFLFILVAFLKKVFFVNK